MMPSVAWAVFDDPRAVPDRMPPPTETECSGRAATVARPDLLMYGLPELPVGLGPRFFQNLPLFLTFIIPPPERPDAMFPVGFELLSPDRPTAAARAE